VKNQLKINQLSEEGFEWYLQYLRAVDETDAEKFGAFLAEDCEFQFGNQTKVNGKTAIVEGLKQFWKTYDGEEHVLQNILGNDRCFALEALNIYQRKDGKKVTCPAVAITERNDAGLVTSFRVFIDIAPLYADK
jgi:ketosteroid isomerase-like protein